MKIRSLYKGSRLYLIALALMGSAVGASSAEVAQTTIPKTELILDSGYTLTWAGGPLVKVCATADNTQCVTGKIPKIVGTFYGVSAYPNLAGAKASWITTSKTDSFMCSLALTAPTVTCAKIPAAPVKLVRVGMTVKVVTLDNSQAINETRNIMEGELGFAAMTSSTSSSTMGACPRPNKPADEEGCSWEFNEDKFEWECIQEIEIIGTPEDPNDCKTADDDACDGTEPEPEEELPEEPEPEACPMNMTSALAVVNSDAKLSFDFWSFIWVVNPSEPTTSQNTVTCDGNGNMVAVFNHPDNAGWKCPAVRDCMEVHEDSHKNDMLGQNPNICQGQPKGIAVGNNDNAELMQSELAAFQAEISCLQEKKKDKCAMQQNDCSSEIQQVETYINTIAIPKVKAGTYGK